MAIIILIVGSLAYVYLGKWNSDSHLENGDSSVYMFHAGSLSNPFLRMDEENKEFILEREPSGSVQVMRKITDLGKTPDIAATSDYSLIQDYLIPKYTDWYAQIARNEIVIAYTEESKYSEDINDNNWYNILSRKDVDFAFGNPNADPGGYRTMMAIQLAEDYYGKDKIFDELIAANTGMDAPEKSEGSYLIEAVKLEELNPSDKVLAGAMEVAVVPALEKGSVDYMFNYRSIAEQHGFNFVELPAPINLSRVEYAETYKTAKIRLTDGTIKSGKPIVYGITILKNAKNRNSALKFLKYVLSEPGGEIFRNMGQPPIRPAVTNDKEKIPKVLQDLVVES